MRVNNTKGSIILCRSTPPIPRLPKSPAKKPLSTNIKTPPNLITTLASPPIDKKLINFFNKISYQLLHL